MKACVMDTGCVRVSNVKGYNSRKGTSAPVDERDEYAKKRGFHKVTQL